MKVLITEKQYTKLIGLINEITSEKLQECAKKYFNWNDLTIVTAG
jgi:predicted Zn-dependent peptidase